MNDLKPFNHGEEGTHYACDVALKEGNTCCGCTKHDCPEQGAQGYMTLKHDIAHRIYNRVCLDCPGTPNLDAKKHNCTKEDCPICSRLAHKTADEVWDEALHPLIEEIDFFKIRVNKSDYKLVQDKLNEIIKAVNKLLRP